MYPYYGKHFTQSPSLQPRLFLDCNPICLIFKVLLQDGFLFVRGRLARFPRQFMNPVRSSGCSPLLIRSRLLYNAKNPCLCKDFISNLSRITRLVVALVYMRGCLRRSPPKFIRPVPTFTFGRTRGFHSQAKFY